MGLPLLFGIIAYLLIILFMSIWLTKYHAENYWVSNREHLLEEEKYRGSKLLEPETNMLTQGSQTTIQSGSQSSVPQKKGGVGEEGFLK